VAIERLPTAEEIRARLSTQIMGQRILVYSSVRSTNDLCKKLAREGAVEGTLVLADEQTQGRGRRGRTWYSPRGKGLWFSVVLRPEVEPARLGLLSLLAAVSVAEAVERTTGLSPHVKWPNDVLMDHQKVAGILVETEISQERVSHVVAGVGINISQRQEDFPPELRSQVTSLEMAAGKSVDRWAVLTAVLQALETSYLAYLGGKEQTILQQWLQRCLHLECGIRVVRDNGSVLEGQCVGIDQAGRMLLRTQSEEIHAVDTGVVDKITPH